MRDYTARQIRIADDTGLSISEVQEYLDEGLIQFNEIYKKYYISETEIKKSRRPYLTAEELRWLTR